MKIRKLLVLLTVVSAFFSISANAFATDPYTTTNGAGCSVRSWNPAWLGSGPIYATNDWFCGSPIDRVKANVYLYDSITQTQLHIASYDYTVWINPPPGPNAYWGSQTWAQPICPDGRYLTWFQHVTWQSHNAITNTWSTLAEAWSNGTPFACT